MVVMVVGGNGQLGSACCAELVRRGAPVRASVREISRGTTLQQSGVEVVELDLTSGSDARRRALEGVECVVLSANAVVPRAGDRPADVDRALAELVGDAEAVGVRRVVLPSIPVSSVDRSVPSAHSRRELEQRLLDAPMQPWVLRLPPFTDVWLALVGSSVPLRGEEHATLDRPSPFLRRFRRATGRLVEDRGVMLVPGPATHRHAFIAVADAARACAEAALRPEAAARPVEVAGPEVLSWNDVAAVYADVLQRRVRVVTTPALAYAAAARALAPVADVPARTMGLNRYLAESESAWTDAGGGLVDPATMTTVESFLRAKASLPDVYATR